MGSRGKIGVIACNSGKPFAQRILVGLEHQREKAFGRKKKRRVNYVPMTETHFPNGEIKTHIDQSIRGMDIYIVQDAENKVDKLAIDKNVTALRHAMDSAWRAGAGKVTAVLPYLPYSRQEVARGRECIAAAKMIRDLEASHANHILTLDVHSPAIAGVCSTAKFEDLHAAKNLLDYIKANIPTRNLKVCSPDTGAVERNRYFANNLQTDLAMLWKRRDYSGGGSIEERILLGDVNGKDILLVDDMVATGGTLVSGCELLKKEGAKDIYFATSLPLFTDPAISRIDQLYEKAMIKKIIGTDAIYHGGQEFQAAHPWYTEVSVAGYFAKVIWNLNRNESISELLKD